MADALPSWWAEAAGTVAAAVAARFAWLLRTERRQKATDRRQTAAAAVLEEIERSRPAYRLPTPWVDQVRTEAAAVSAAQMRVHEDHVRGHIEALGELKPRVTALEAERVRQDQRLDRIEEHMDATRQAAQSTALLVARMAGKLGIEE